MSEDNNDEKPTLQHIYIYKDLLIQEETMEKTIFPYVKKKHMQDIFGMDVINQSDAIL